MRVNFEKKKTLNMKAWSSKGDLDCIVHVICGILCNNLVLSKGITISSPLRFKIKDFTKKSNKDKALLLFVF